MQINFVANGDGSYQVEGRGSNRFGKFQLRGTLGSDHMINVCREYQAKPVPAPRKRPATAAGIEEGGSGVTGADGSTLPPQKKAAVAPTRDTTVKRDRKPSLTISDPSAVTVFTRPPSTKHATAAGSSSSSSATAMDNGGSGRPQRPPPHVQKCQELLKDMSKYQQVHITHTRTLSTYHHYLSHILLSITTYQYTLHPLTESYADRTYQHTLPVYQR